jgi:hypothetical protein
MLRHSSQFQLAKLNRAPLQHAVVFSSKSLAAQLRTRFRQRDRHSYGDGASLWIGARWPSRVSRFTDAGQSHGADGLDVFFVLSAESGLADPAPVKLDGVGGPSYSPATESRTFRSENRCYFKNGRGRRHVRNLAVKEESPLC